MKLSELIQDRYSKADDFLAKKRILWSEIDNIVGNKLSDALSQTRKSKMVDPKLPSYIIERSNRVMAQFSTGKYLPISNDDTFSARLINLVVEKHVIPNAKAQFPLLTKLRMMDRYSGFYANSFALVDLDVKANGYNGPDLWLIDIRDVFPQVGAVSLEDSDYIILRSYQPISYFERLKNVKNLDKIIETLKKKTGDKENKDASQTSTRQTSEYPTRSTSVGDGQYEILSMYERDRWVDYVPALGNDDGIIRDIKNPHDDGELPVICKQSIPMLDDFFGMSDMERGMPIQKMLNSLWNLYLDSVKISIFPPTILNKDKIVPSSIKQGAAQKWLVRGAPQDAVMPFPVNPQGTNTFNNVYQVGTAALLNLLGTTTTSTTAQTDPSFGKTPQALEMQAARENTGDNADRFFMEQTVVDMMRKFANLIVKNKSSGKIMIRMFKSEIEAMQTEFKDKKDQIAEMFDEKKGKLIFDRKLTGSTLFDYEIVSGSTYAVDQEKQMKNLSSFLDFYSKNMQWVDQKLKEENRKVSFYELIKRLMVSGGIQDYEKILVDITKDNMDEATMKSHALMLANHLRDMGVNTPDMSQVPVTPNSGAPSIPVQPMTNAPTQTQSPTAQPIQ